MVQARTNERQAVVIMPKVGLPRTPAKSHELSKTHRSQKRPVFDNIVLLLQGGGALGAYQGGVYQALAEADLYPDWVAGISIGSINAAIIAGNPPNQRVEKLRKFWEGITSPSFNVMGRELDSLLARRDSARSFLNQMSAITALVSGASGFFRTADPEPMVPSARHGRGDKLLQHDATQSDAGGSCRLRPGKL